VEIALFDRMHAHGDARQIFIEFDQLGVYLYPEELASIVGKYDLDEDGRLDYDEFVKAASLARGHWSSTSRVAAALAGRPPPLKPTDIPIEPSPAEALYDTLEAIRSKVSQHHASSHQAFLALNRKGDAHLSLSELRTGLARWGLRVAEKDLCMLTRAYMQDKRKRFLTAPDFAAFLEGSSRGRARPIATQQKLLVPAGSSQASAVSKVVEVVRRCGQRASAVFHALDANRDGSITPAEFRRGLLAMGYSIDLCTAQQVVKQFDVGKDGRLQYRELLKLLAHNKRSGAARSPSPASGPFATSHRVRSRAAAARATRPLLKEISDAVYGSSLGPGKLYKSMKRHGQLGVHAADLVYGLRKVGVQAPLGQVQGLVEAFDEDKDGQLSLPEWLHLLSAAGSA
ncbi:EFCAB6, partial [Symbiodinium sp. KB8]